MQAQFKRYFPGISVCQLKYLESRNHFSSGLFDYSNRTPQKIAICNGIIIFFSLVNCKYIITVYWSYRCDSKLSGKFKYRYVTVSTYD